MNSKRHTYLIYVMGGSLMVGVAVALSYAGISVVATHMRQSRIEKLYSELQHVDFAVIQGEIAASTAADRLNNLRAEYKDVWNTVAADEVVRLTYYIAIKYALEGDWREASEWGRRALASKESIRPERALILVFLASVAQRPQAVEAALSHPALQDRRQVIDDIFVEYANKDYEAVAAEYASVLDAAEDNYVSMLVWFLAARSWAAQGVFDQAYQCGQRAEAESRFVFPPLNVQVVLDMSMWAENDKSVPMGAAVAYLKLAQDNIPRPGSTKLSKSEQIALRRLEQRERILGGGR